MKDIDIKKTYMITKKAKGGKGKREVERNQALATLFKVDKEKFNVSVLSRVFERDRSTIYGILELEGVIHR